MGGSAIYPINDGVGITIAGPAPPAEGLLIGLLRPLASTDYDPHVQAGD
jgi:hypothetical protein